MYTFRLLVDNVYLIDKNKMEGIVVGLAEIRNFEQITNCPINIKQSKL